MNDYTEGCQLLYGASNQIYINESPWKLQLLWVLGHAQVWSNF